MSSTIEEPMASIPEQPDAVVAAPVPQPYFKLAIAIDATSEKELLKELLSIYNMYLGNPNKPRDVSHDCAEHTWAVKYEEPS
jgi:hypothetical protein